MAVLALFFLSLSGAAANATCPVIPFVFADGTPWLASQVNANFTAIRNCVLSSVVATGTSTTGHLPKYQDATGSNITDSGYPATRLAPLGATPEDYGAAADCSTNDTTPLQTAINVAQSAPNGEVSLATKCYLFTPPLSITQTASLVGRGMFQTQLKSTAAPAVNLIAIGGAAPASPQTQGVQLKGVRITANSPTAGYCISARHTANTVIEYIYLDGCWGGIEDEQSNNDLIQHVWGTTIGTNSQALLWWTDGTAMAAGGRSDQLTVNDFHVNLGFYGNDGFVWKGFANTLNMFNSAFLQTKHGFWVDASLSTGLAYPAFGSIYNLQVEGAQVAACEIDGARHLDFTDGFCHSQYGEVGPGGTQGNNDTAALVILGDDNPQHGQSSSLSFQGMSIGGSAHEGGLIQAIGVEFSNVRWAASSYSAIGSYPSVRLRNITAGFGSGEFKFSNNQFCGLGAGEIQQNDYGIIREADVGSVTITGSNFGGFAGCLSGEVQDNSSGHYVDGPILGRGNIGINGRLLPDTNGTWVSGTVPTLGADCGAGATISGNNLSGTIAIGGAGAVTQCTITMANTNAAANNGIGFFGPALWSSTTPNKFYITTAVVGGTQITFTRMDGTAMPAAETIAYRIWQANS